MQECTFHFARPDSQELPLHVHTACRREFGAFVSGKLKQPFWVLDDSISNVGFCRVGERAPWFSRAPGWLHLYPPGTIYEEDSQCCERHESAFLIFEGAEALGLDRLTANSRSFGRIYDPHRQIAGMIGEIARIGMVRGNQGWLSAVAGLMRIADRLLHHTVPWEEEGDFVWRLELQPVEPGFGDQDLSRRVRHYLELNFREAVDLKRIAQKLGVSKSTLSHRYKVETGESVFHTLLRIRVEQSLPLLRSGERLKNVAANVGFCDEFYYSRVFRKLQGVPPGEFRKK